MSSSDVIDAAARRGKDKIVAVASKSGETSVKETVEAILVAFILAFIFRAFVVEAFVIPTGSMAPTLLGAHMRYRCDDCGFEFTTNYQGIGDDSGDVNIPRTARFDPPIWAKGADGQLRPVSDRTYRVHCPNCGFRIPKTNVEDPSNVSTNPPVNYGDRILVLKYVYLLNNPNRWDVVVFKSPVEPQKYDYQQNYIKRLIGRPGETIMILDGDVYVSEKGEESLPEDFHVQTKPRHVQNALWRIIYDNDHHPRGRARSLFDEHGSPMVNRLREQAFDPPWQQPWRVMSDSPGWNEDGKRTFTFDNLSGSAALEFDPNANRYQWSFTDYLAYDITAGQNPNVEIRDGRLRFGEQDGGNPGDMFTANLSEQYNIVTDAKLSLFYERRSGDGPLRLHMSKFDDEFVAVIEPQKVRLLRKRQDGPAAEIASAAVDMTSGKPVKIDLQNVDYQVTLMIDGKIAIQTTPEQYAPDIRKVLKMYAAREQPRKPRVAIEPENQQAVFSHISLWRDVAYNNRHGSGTTGQPINWASPEPVVARMEDREYRGPSRLAVLGPKECFVCGDNSPISYDARLWSAYNRQSPAPAISLPHEDLFADSGRIPERFLIGKAFFVYWPAGFRPFESGPSVIPNFGEMRFIH